MDPCGFKLHFNFIPGINPQMLVFPNQKRNSFTLSIILSQEFPIWNVYFYWLKS